MPLPISQWTDERVAAITKYAGEGYSCSQIAALVGDATRNSVIGKLHRLGISTNNAPHGGFKKQKRVPRPRGPKPTIFATRWGASDARVKPPLDFTLLRKADVAPLHVTFMDLALRGCKFPFGEGPYTFCGHGAIADSSYCDQHHRIVYRQPQDRGPRPDTAALNRQRYPKSQVLAALEVAEEAA